MTAERHEQSLEELAGALGVTRSYIDGTGCRRLASDEAVLAVVRVLGVPLERIGDAEEALREMRAASTTCGPPPVLTAVAGQHESIAIPWEGFDPQHASLTLESGETTAAGLERPSDGRLRVRLPRTTPSGYHHLHFEGPNLRLDISLLISPARLPQATRGWGLFAPLYGIRAPNHDRFATYGDLARVASWMTNTATTSRNARGAAYLGTLPLLACFFEEPFEPSPYSPISRAFWSELYVDPADSPEFDRSEEARRLLENAPATRRRSGTAASTGERRIDYRGELGARRQAIEALLRTLDEHGANRRRDDFENAIEDDDELARYAAFRAAVERYGSTWETWPRRARSGELRAGADYDGEAFRYHAYAQWLAREQIAAAAAASPAGFYLDLPLGCHVGGYDTWRHRDEFAIGVSAGAPPDGVFEGGQNWAFPPLHPERARRHGYASVRAALRHHFAHATVLRVDHVMGLHRLFWIPDGFPTSDGVYVRSHSAELWAILAIEAERARGGAGAAVVGEDLGTVPDEVRREIDARGALRMHVIPFECCGDNTAPVAPPAACALSCLGTHDMDPFVVWWESQGGGGASIGGGGASVEGSGAAIARFLGCEPDAASVLAAMLAWMSASDAAIVCANLEDLWLERERQNLPGTVSAHGNWQRPSARGFEEFAADPVIGHLLDLVRGTEQNAGGTETAESCR